jgi:hypothetical protein
MNLIRLCERCEERFEESDESLETAAGDFCGKCVGELLRLRVREDENHPRIGKAARRSVWNGSMGGFATKGDVK